MSLAAVTPLPADVLSGCYCDQQLRFLGGGRQVPPRFKLRRVGPRPFTVGVVNSFGGGFVWILWLAHQVRSVVAATSLADSTESIKDWPLYSVYKFVELESDFGELCWLARK